MQTFKERLTAMVGHLGEHVALFAREEFSRAVTCAIVGDRAGSPATAILMVVHDGINRSIETPLHEAMRAFIYRTLREVMSEECDDSPMSNHMREFVARTISSIVTGDLDEAAEPGMLKAHQDLIVAIDGASEAFSEDSRIRAIVREEIARATLTAGGK